jgi:hypothetical protein
LSILNPVTSVEASVQVTNQNVSFWRFWLFVIK